MRLVSGILLAILFTCPAIGAAQPAAGPPQPSSPPRAFVDLNLIGTARSASGPREFQSRFITFGEAGYERATYPKPAQTTMLPSLDVGAGYITGSLLGIGLNISRTSFEDEAVIATTVPHPVFLNVPGTGVGVTDRRLSRDETAISAYVTAVPLRTSRMELRFFGGPTYFRINAEMVQNVSYSQTATVTPLANTLSVTGFTTTDAKGGGLGFHLGTDFTYFLTRMIGVRAGIRYSHAQVTVKNEPLSRLTQQLIAGGPSLSLGARFRFGKQ